VVNRSLVEDKSCTSAVTYRNLSTRDDCAAVVALEREIWGPDYDEAVPLALLLVTAARGAILIGAFEDYQMIGFVYSLRGVKNGSPIQWSYKLGVARRHRNEGLGCRLKLLQRERALAMGIELIEWTFDPMLAPNAHLNLTKLGATAQEYAEDLYGESLAPVLQRKIPTDRLIASWNIRDTRGQRKPSPVVSHGEENIPRPVMEGAVPANRAAKHGEWLECSQVSLDIEAPRLMVEIPLNYSEMVSCAPVAALDWRLSVRRIFETYFGRGYRAVDFLVDPANRKGAYVLVQHPN